MLPDNPQLPHSLPGTDQRFTFAVDRLTDAVIGRASDLFIEDKQSRAKEIHAKVAGRRILVVGGAGSIGSATVKELAAFAPAALHVIDHDENGLAELVRDMRSSDAEFAVDDFRLLPLDFGSPVMRGFLEEAGPYDLVLNFAAVKHVRSEKDAFSLLQLLDTNVVKAARFLRWLSQFSRPCRYFSVSTDKAADTASLMGASKRIMEHLLFSGEVVSAPDLVLTSARFPNVAFSQGSLLHSFLKRLEKSQPLAAPRETRRYLISGREAGQLCILAAVCGPANHLVIPRLDPDRHVATLDSVARKVLELYGFRPRLYESESAAKTGLQSDVAQGFYPLLLTPLDTSGEKPIEEFLSSGEEVVEIGMAGLVAVKYRPSAPETLSEFLKWIEDAVEGEIPAPTKKGIIRSMKAIVPELRHTQRGRSLDERM